MQGLEHSTLKQSHRKIDAKKLLETVFLYFANGCFFCNTREPYMQLQKDKAIAKVDLSETILEPILLVYIRVTYLTSVIRKQWH